MGAPQAPADIQAVESDTDVDCTLGKGTRTRTVSKEYDWSDSGGWVIEPEADWELGDWSDWSYVELTPAEKATNKCPTPKEPSDSRRVDRSEPSCDRGGVVSWTDVYTTDYAWNAATWQWDVVGETGPVVTDESVAEYTDEELKANCSGSGGGGNGGGGNGGGGNGGTDNPGTDIPPVIAKPELIPVTPNYASATDATCSQRGALIVPSQDEGVLTTRTGSVPGTVTFTYAPENGYAFPAGTVTEAEGQGREEADRRRVPPR